MKQLSFTVIMLAGLLTACIQPNTHTENVNKSSVTLSTSTSTPLIAYYSQDTINTGEITVRVKGKTQDMDIAHTYPVGYGSKFPIFGLYPDYANTVEVTYKSVTSTFTVTTKALPQDDDTATTVLISNLSETADAFNQDLYFFSTAHRYIKAIDKKGDIRYYFNPSTGIYMYRTYLDKVDNKIYFSSTRGIYNLEGNRILTYPGAFHHDMIEYNNDYYLALDGTKYGVEDLLTQITKNGTVVKKQNYGNLFRKIVDVSSNPDHVADLENLNKIVYDEKNIFGDTNNNGIEDAGETFEKKDWAHANSLVYDSDSDTLYVSLRHQGVIAVDYSAWELLWWMADDDLHVDRAFQPALDEEGNPITLHDIKALEPYQVKGIAATDGPKAQHALFLHKNGNLGLFDNQGDTDATGAGSRYIEYNITGNFDSGYSATEERKIYYNGLYSPQQGDVDFVGENQKNLLFSFALLGRIVEVDEAGNTIFDVEGTGRFTYRVDKMPLYPYADTTKSYSLDYNAKDGK